MNIQRSKRAARARTPTVGSGLSAAFLLFAGLILAGCGGSSGGASASSDPEQPSAVEEPPVESSEDEDEAAPVATPLASADVLLIKPAGYSDLPPATKPTMKFAKVEGMASDALASVANIEALQSGNVTVSWDPPSENADGSSLQDLAGYRVYQGSPDQLNIVQELNETGSGQRRLTQVPDVTTDNACFAVTAVDTNSNESALGDIACKEVIVATPPTNSLAPALTSVTQLSTNDGQAEVQLSWQPPATSSAAAGATINQYSIFHGSQSQLFKIKEITDESARSGNGRSNVVSNVGGEQACFALTARYTDGTETSLSEIVCIALVHTAAPQPGDELRPFNVSVDLLGGNTASVSWNKPNTVVSSADATAIDSYDLYQGSQSQVFKITEIDESGAAGTRRSTSVENVFDGSHCFALTATDQSLRQSALSTIVCARLPSDSDTGAAPTQPAPGTGVIGVANINAQETSPGSIAIAWDAPELVAVGQPIGNLAGYNLYQGSETQLFKVAEIAHDQNTAAQQAQRTEVDVDNACFAVTAYDSNGFEAPLSPVICVQMSGAASVPQGGIVPPTDLATSALGGARTVTLSWLASGAAATGSADPSVNRYNIYQGDHDRLFKVREIREVQDPNPRGSATFTGVTAASACFAITAQYQDLRESRLSDIVCRDD